VIGKCYTVVLVSTLEFVLIIYEYIFSVIKTNTTSQRPRGIGRKCWSKQG